MREGQGRWHARALHHITPLGGAGDGERPGDESPAVGPPRENLAKGARIEVLL